MLKLLRTGSSFRYTQDVDFKPTTNSLSEFKALESLVYKRARSPPKISSAAESKNLTFDNKNILGTSLSENNLLANFKKVSNELNVELYQKKDNEEDEISINNNPADDDNFDNFFVAIAEYDEKNASG